MLNIVKNDDIHINDVPNDNSDIEKEVTPVDEPKDISGNKYNLK